MFKCIYENSRGERITREVAGKCVKCVLELVTKEFIKHGQIFELVRVTS